MQNPDIKDSDKFKAVASQEEARLGYLHPTLEGIPACMTAFDDFLSCNILGTQLKSIYRFGEMAHCSAKWNEFKFCMSVKGLHPEQWRDAWILRRAECWARPRLGLSSENVWEMRAEPLRELPTTFTPTRCHGGTCRMNLIFEPIYRFATLVFDLLESKWWD
ncbi:hypothetical protein DFH94DRAFT_626771 [Russula ochroleuca]|uniref:Uncharacterized protein n=1 Tax=Russula ochroleuca TaxID=152965 RepID=A0A9P5MZQ8_9AGAM|nr:hypothetical protein DFH94DRAFT_626771 [Russula ochroleuca]